MGFILKIKEKQHDLFARNFFSELCEKIVTEILQKKTEDDKDAEKFAQVIDENKVKLLLFIEGYYNFSVWKNYKQLVDVEMDKLNILHWVLFYDKPLILKFILRNF